MRLAALLEVYRIASMNWPKSWALTYPAVSHHGVAYVRIQEAIQLANLDAVRRMDLKPGDRVVQSVDHTERSLKEALGEEWESVAGQFPREFEVSSIREDGQVFFKGGRGQAPARYLDKVTNF